MPGVCAWVLSLFAIFFRFLLVYLCSFARFLVERPAIPPKHARARVHTHNHNSKRTCSDDGAVSKVENVVVVVVVGFTRDPSVADLADFWVIADFRVADFRSSCAPGLHMPAVLCSCTSSRSQPSPPLARSTLMLRSRRWSNIINTLYYQLILLIVEVVFLFHFSDLVASIPLSLILSTSLLLRHSSVVFHGVSSRNSFFVSE